MFWEGVLWRKIAASVFERWFRSKVSNQFWLPTLRILFRRVENYLSLEWHLPKCNYPSGMVDQVWPGSTCYTTIWPLSSSMLLKDYGEICVEFKEWYSWHAIYSLLIEPKVDRSHLLFDAFHKISKLLHELNFSIAVQIYVRKLW